MNTLLCEDRACPRTECREPFQYHTGQRSALGVVTDFSLTGLQVRLDAKLEPGSFISLRPLNSSCLYDSPLEGQVVWSVADPEAGRFVAGLRIFGETGPFGGRIRQPD